MLKQNIILLAPTPLHSTIGTWVAHGSLLNRNTCVKISPESFIKMDPTKKKFTDPCPKNVKSQTQMKAFN